MKRKEYTLSASHNKKDLIIFCYSDKKKSEKKNILFLTTIHDKLKVIKDQGFKPQALVMYDHTEGGLDVADLISCYH